MLRSDGVLGGNATSFLSLLRAEHAALSVSGGNEVAERFKGRRIRATFYAAFFAGQDERVGLLLAQVHELGLRERTVVVF